MYDYLGPRTLVNQQELDLLISKLIKSYHNKDLKTLIKLAIPITTFHYMVCSYPFSGHHLEVSNLVTVYFIFLYSEIIHNPYIPIRNLTSHFFFSVSNSVEMEPYILTVTL